MIKGGQFLLSSGGQFVVAPDKALIHMQKAQAWPLSGEVLHWQAEARVFRSEAADRFAPSMHQRINLARI
jgi:hypothetical protein